MAYLMQEIVRAAGGYAHSVALTAEGAVYAWGCSTYGQVGTGGITKVTSPSKVHFPSPVTHLTTAYFHNVSRIGFITAICQYCFQIALNISQYKFCNCYELCKPTMEV